jgi:hypothetical protein
LILDNKCLSVNTTSAFRAGILEPHNHRTCRFECTAGEDNYVQAIPAAWIVVIFGWSHVKFWTLGPLTSMSTGYCHRPLGQAGQKNFRQTDLKLNYPCIWPCNSIPTTTIYHMVKENINVRVVIWIYALALATGQQNRRDFLAMYVCYSGMPAYEFVQYTPEWCEFSLESTWNVTVKRDVLYVKFFTVFCSEIRFLTVKFTAS